MMQLSPMMQQYMDIKDEHRDCILFFRLGDFYEMFYEDAILASRELELTLTGKNCGQEERAPMCGVPYHAAETYISKLVERGHKVAICEQVEDPAKVKGLVKREVIQIVTPGTLTSGAMLNEKENNYLASVYAKGEDIGFSYCDISTGELNVTELSGSGAYDTLLDELARINAREIIMNEGTAGYLDPDDAARLTGACINVLNSNYFNLTSGRNAVFRQFSVKSLAGLGLEDHNAAVHALGAQLLYLFETQKQYMEQITELVFYHTGSYMALDKTAIRNLEITETLFERKTEGSLLWILDKTNTAMGSRKMKRWLKEPLVDTEEIQERLDSVEALVDDIMLRNNIRESLKAVYDFERLGSRIACGSANGKDLIALKASLLALPEIKLDLEDSRSRMLRDISDQIDPLEEIFHRIEAAIVDDPPFTIRDGGLIKPGFSSELDDIRNGISDAQTWIASLESKERERTGIGNLKVGYNKVFGYYIEVSKSNYDKVPDDYIRKQTLVNAERYITPELKEAEGKVLNAESRINELEHRLFCELRDYIKKFIRQLQQTSAAVSALDVIASFAEVSDQLGYVKPAIDAGDEIIIEKGRHPVIEQTAEDGVFVANDVYIDRKEASLLLITGPNMSGKSTYMRQTALIVLMAQAGCFVPCERAQIGICDRIFTRIGASDNLSRGESTFFVEMNELAYILNNATERSLVILDEIGRGTSTYDGLSIAWAAAEYLCRDECRIRTLFATHYHELTALSETLKGFKNLNVAVSEDGSDVIFLHKIVDGPASRSYGIHVARLAGVPKELLERAEEKLQQLEETAEDISSGVGQQIKFKF